MENELANDVNPMTEKILDAARAQVRRYGEAKTNVVDIARALGTSHTTIYRHFRSKNDVFDAIVVAAMRDEEALARAYVHADGPASERLLSFVLALHQRKRERLKNDPELYQLYRRVVDERPDIVRDYAQAMTRLVAAILSDGVNRNEFRIDDIAAAAGVVRDAATTYVDPARVEAAVRSGLTVEPAIRNTMNTLIVAFRTGMAYGGPKRVKGKRDAKG